MSDEPASITEWCQRAASGDQQAISEIYNRFFERLAVLARNRLGSLRRVSDEEDVAHEALGKFFSAVQRGAFHDLSDRDHIWKTLAKIADNQAKDHIRYSLRERRGGGMVRGDSVMESPDGGNHGFDDIPDPSPEYVDRFIDAFGFIEKLEGELRDIALWKIAGESNKMIGTRFGHSEEWARLRVLTVRDQLDHLALSLILPEDDLLQVELWLRDGLKISEIAERLEILDTSVVRMKKLIDKRLGRTKT